MTSKQITAAPKPLTWLLAPALAAALTACGGGGGSTTAPTPTPSPAPAPAPTPAVPDCVAKVETVGACQFNVPALKAGANAAIENTTTGYKGSLTASCSAAGVYSTTTPTCTQTTEQFALQTAVPTPTYTQGSAQMTAFEVLNRNRSSCGFGLLAQNQQLDRSATNHGNYFVALSDADFLAYLKNPHTEIVGKTGFTGISLLDRIRYTGYVTTGQSYDATQSISFGNYSLDATGTMNEVGQAVLGIRDQLTSILHMAALMGPYREVGFGTPRVANAARNGIFAPVVVDLGHNTSPQYSQDLVSYPCQGVTDAGYRFSGESPDPLAGLPVTYPLGTPIMFAAAMGATQNAPTVVVKSASVTPKNGGESFSTANNTIYVYTQPGKTNRQFVLPLKPLAPATEYTVTATVTVNGVDTVRTFSFTTWDGEIGKYFNAPLPQ